MKVEGPKSIKLDGPEEWKWTAQKIKLAFGKQIVSCTLWPLIIIVPNCMSNQALYTP